MPMGGTAVAAGGLGAPSPAAIFYFFFGLVVVFGVTFWVANKNRIAGEFYAGARRPGPVRNGLALAGDYMSAASFLGVAGLCALDGYDGMVYAVGWFVGWPLLLILVGEPLRNLGRFTVADAVAFRFRRAPVRFASAIGGILTILFYTAAQMVASGNLLALLFGISYPWAEGVVIVFSLAYLSLGGMFSTTWTQVVKAVLMLLAVTLLMFSVLHQYDFRPAGLFRAVSSAYGTAALSPGGFFQSPLEAVSLGIALMFGAIGLPHLLTHFFAISETRVARVSVVFATGFIGYFYCLIPIVGFGAATLVGGRSQGRALIAGVDAGGNMAAPLLAHVLGGAPFLGFVAVVAFATVLAALTGLILSGAFAFSHDIYANVMGRGSASEPREIGVTRKAAVALCLCSGLMGSVLHGQNVGFLVGLAFAVAASANAPALLLSIFWRRFTTAGAVWSILTGAVISTAMIVLGPTVWGEVLGHRGADGLPVGLIPLRNPAVVSMTAALVVGVLASLVTRDPGAEELFREQTLGRYLGPGAR